jgi:hypothetical protein
MSIENLSSKELYELYKRRELEEQEQNKEKIRAQVEDLRARRREMLAQHKRELAAIEKEISDLTGRRPAATTSANSDRALRGDFSNKILDIIREAGTISTDDLRDKLTAESLSIKNLSQQLAYLKRKGRIKPDGRAVYTLA